MADDNPLPNGPGYAGAPGRTRPGHGPHFGVPAPPTVPLGPPGPTPPPPPVASARFPDEPPPEPRTPGAPPPGAAGSELPGAGPVHPPRPPYPGRPPAPRRPTRPGPRSPRPPYPAVGEHHPTPPPDHRTGGGYWDDDPHGPLPPGPGDPRTWPAPTGPYEPGPFDDEPVHRLPGDGLRDPADRDPDHRPGRFARYRAATAAGCIILGLGLIGGAVTGSWLTGDSTAAPGPADRFAALAELWHSTPVDELFPRTVRGEEAGPGGADRLWRRVAVAPDSTCAKGLDPLLHQALDPAGCERLVRATYTDDTRSHLTTVGLLFTKADAKGMRALRTRVTEQGLDRSRELMPRPYAVAGTPAAGFGDQQRATWTLSVLTDAPVIAFAVSGFADGRTVTDPEPATEAARGDGTSAAAQSGLGHEAKGLADRIERGLRARVTAAAEKTP
ncbi:hypothetical protein [Streptomyces sp. NPDC005955]|uniref:hypothetical protein n=1 Tax=Streptomyces sp. NPDC005955 TaxID=3364738 RepID=UPI0036A6C45F